MPLRRVFRHVNNVSQLCRLFLQTDRMRKQQPSAFDQDICSLKEFVGYEPEEVAAKFHVDVIKPGYHYETTVTRDMILDPTRVF